MILTGIIFLWTKQHGSRTKLNLFPVFRHSDFVQETVLDRLKPGRIIEFFLLTVINPFTVSVNATGKKRLILD